MATRDDSTFVVGAGEARGAQLAQTAIGFVIVLLHQHGYPEPTREQFRDIAHRITQEALACGVATASDPEITDDMLDAAALNSASAVIAEVLGPPPARTLN